MNKTYLTLLKRCIVVVTLVLVAAGSAMAAPASLKARLDTTVIEMGRTTTLCLELVQDKGARGYFPSDRADTLSTAVEIQDRVKPDTADLGNNRVQVNKRLIIQSFDSGVYVLPPVVYITASGDTVASNRVTLKVVPVKVKDGDEIVDFKPVEEIPSKLLDWVPDFVTNYWWAFLLAFLVIACAASAYGLWWRKGINPLKPEKKRLPPYEEAVQRLQELKQRQLWQNGEEKEYYTVLTDILRDYIYRRFQVNAVEMTSSEIVATLKKNDETRAVNEQLSEILAMADFVKFANVKPIADDNEMAFTRASQFVEHTRPVEQPADETAKAGKKDAKDKKSGKNAASERGEEASK